MADEKRTRARNRLLLPRPFIGKSQQAAPEASAPKKDGAPNPERDPRTEEEKATTEKAKAPKKAKAPRAPKDKGGGGGLVSGPTDETPPVPEQPTEPRDASRGGEEKIVYLNLRELHVFKNHPFKVRD